MQRRPLRTRPINQALPPKELAIPVEEAEEYIEFFSNPRNGFCIGEGRVIISLDYASQELRVAAVVSKDPAMCNSYFQPATLISPTTGKEYVNPANDLHLLTTATVTHPHLVEGKPEEEWYDLLTIIYPGEKTTPRQLGKMHNFGSIYLSSPQAVSTRNHIKLAVAEDWVKRHKITYAGYYKWAEEYGSIAAARGFAVAPYTSRQRWIAEERSSGKEGDSAVRAAVNHAVQSISADQSKESMIRLDETFEETPALLIGQVHD